METKIVKIERCSDSDWWYNRCEGMTVVVYRKPRLSYWGNIVYLTAGTRDRTILVEDVVEVSSR